MDEKHLFKPQIMSTIIEMLPHTQTKDLQSHMLNELRNIYMNRYDSKYGIKTVKVEWGLNPEKKPPLQMSLF